MPLRRDADEAIVTGVQMDQRKGPVTVPFLFVRRSFSVGSEAVVAQ